MIPDNTIGYISVNNKKEAHYICSLLNSNRTQALFSLKSSKSKWGISIQMVNQVPIKEFDKNNSTHIELARLSENAHKIKSESKIKEIENKINIVVNQNNIFHD